MYQRQHRRTKRTVAIDGMGSEDTSMDVTFERIEVPNLFSSGSCLKEKLARQLGGG